jgi:pyruvate formate lyase activating enzyme
MQCAWCSTPESQRFQAEIGFDLSKCVLCGECAKACPNGALILDKTPSVRRELCSGCFACAETCRKRAIKKYGGEFGVTEIAREVCKDEIFYFHSGGGVTLSGGEPCAQADFAAELLRELKKRGIHASIETALCVPWENIEVLLPYLDCVLADLKHMNPEQHKRWTGIDNALILDNIRRLDSLDFSGSLIMRIPLIPGINDDDENLKAVAVFARELTKKLQAIELLPYHRLGINTYKTLRRPYSLESVALSPWERITERAKFLSACEPGVPVLAGNLQI